MPANMARTCENMPRQHMGSKLMPMFLRSSGSMLMPKGFCLPPEERRRGSGALEEAPHCPGRLPLRRVRSPAPASSSGIPRGVKLEASPWWWSGTSETFS